MTTQIRCGKCKSYHRAIDQVRACHTETACSWLVVVGYDEDGQDVIRECGYSTTITDRGYSCSMGHSHVYCEARRSEGWDYAEGAEEAESLLKYGTEPRDLVTGGAFRF